jgi:site-specific recombinase XerD
VWFTQEQFDKLLSGSDDEALTTLLQALWHTGAPPREVLDATAANLDRGERCLRYAKGKGGRPRIVYLNDAAFAIFSKLADECPEGPLFKNSLGKKWSSNLISARLRVLKERTGIAATMYAMRHSFATRAILAGIDLETLRILMGHANLVQISKVYSHVAKVPAHLHSALGKL